jgi:hypothetical protein
MIYELPTFFAYRRPGGLASFAAVDGADEARTRGFAALAFTRCAFFDVSAYEYTPPGPQG